MEALRALLAPKDVLDPPLRTDLARAYTYRGKAKGGAVLDSEGAWDIPLRHDLAAGNMNRGVANFAIGNRVGACADARDARGLIDPLTADYGRRSPPDWFAIAKFAVELERRSCGDIKNDRSAGSERSDSG